MTCVLLFKFYQILQVTANLRIRKICHPELVSGSSVYHINLSYKSLNTQTEAKTQLLYLKNSCACVVNER